MAVGCLLQQGQGLMLQLRKASLFWAVDEGSQNALCSVLQLQEVVLAPGGLEECQAAGCVLHAAPRMPSPSLAARVLAASLRVPGTALVLQVRPASDGFSTVLSDIFCHTHCCVCDTCRCRALQLRGRAAQQPHMSCRTSDGRLHR